MSSKERLAQKRREEYVLLENTRHEQFARCIALGNDVLVCYYGVGYPKDRQAAERLAAQKDIRAQADAWRDIVKPFAKYHTKDAHSRKS